MEKDNIGCYAWIVVILICICGIIFIRHEDTIDVIQRREIEKLQQKIDTFSNGYQIIEHLNKLVKFPCLYRNEKMLVRERIVFEYELLGDFDSALQQLNRYENKYKRTIFSTAHKANICIAKGDTTEALNLFKEIIDKPIRYKPMVWINRIFNQWLNSGRSEEYCRFNEYFYNVFCQIYALWYFASYNKELENPIDMWLSFIKNTSDIRQISEDYIVFQSNYPLDVNYYDNQRYNMNHLYMGDYKKLNSYSGDILRVVLSARMSLANEIMLMADSLYFQSKSKQILSENFMNMPTKDFTDLLLLNALKKYYGIDDSFPTNMSYHNFKKVSKQGKRFLTIASPTTAVDKKSMLIKNGITRDFVVLSCNDWSILDSAVFSTETLKSYINKEKQMIILKENYTIDTLSFSEDKMGALLHYVSVPEVVYQMIVSDFMINVIED
ncbi:MAG: hypothetical protein NC115_10600 [Bacteroidales bacterium]|nr:hypothetical protein [Bacteroidales bacterium]